LESDLVIGTRACEGALDCAPRLTYLTKNSTGFSEIAAIEVDGTIMFVANAAGSRDVYVGLSTPGGAHGSGRLMVISFADPETPSIRASYTLPTAPLDIDVTDTQLVIAAGDAGVVVLPLID
jgi:hypothetical protein